MATAQKPDLSIEETLTRMVGEWQLPLLRTCCAVLGSEDLAKDAVQETFLKAYRGLPSFRGECSEKTWLMRIAINTCRDMRRSAWFRYVDRRITPEILHEPSVQVEKADEELTLAIMRLPRKLKEVIMLYYYQGMKIAEVAATLAVAPSSVSGRLSRAKKKLRTALEGGCFHE